MGDPVDGSIQTKCRARALPAPVEVSALPLPSDSQTDRLVC